VRKKTCFWVFMCEPSGSIKVGNFISSSVTTSPLRTTAFHVIGYLKSASCYIHYSQRSKMAHSLAGLLPSPHPLFKVMPKATILLFYSCLEFWQTEMEAIEIPSAHSSIQGVTETCNRTLGTSVAYQKSKNCLFTYVRKHLICDLQLKGHICKTCSKCASGC
jgi:hypothetical protein